MALPVKTKEGAILNRFLKMNISKKNIIAAFDFDGTLTHRDSFLPFLVYSFGWRHVVWKMVPILPKLIGYLFGIASRQEAKEALITQFFQGRTEQSVRELGEVFAKERLPLEIRPEALRCLRRHQKAGHTCIIVSASLDIWLVPWADANGIGQVLSSRLAFDEKGCVIGKLQGKNCRRQEKVRRMQEALGPLNEYILYAYGDTKGDKEMLEAADCSFYRAFPEEKEE